jgi:hypothetical protein
VSAIVFNRFIKNKDSGDPVNADSTPTISIVRTDTSETVVATTSTGITNPSTGQYTYTLDSPVAGVAYQSTWTFVVSGQTVSPQKTVIAPDSSLPVDWHYSNKSAFEIFNGFISTNIESDLDSQNSGTDDANASLTTNDDKLDDAGTRGDAYIDSRLAALGWAIPLTGMDARTTTTLRDLSNHACRWQLAESRNYGLYVQNGSSIDPAKVGLSDKKYVDDFFQGMEDEKVVLTASGGPTPQTTTSLSGRISASVGHAKVYPGTQGIYVPTHRRWGAFGGRCG